MSDFTFFYGAASGSARKALQLMKEPNVMISYATQHNTPWYGIDRLFVDCGGYSFMMNKGEYGPVQEYADYIHRWEPELYALRDYPCEPDIREQRGTTVEDHQQATTEAHVETLDVVADADATPVAVVQGWEPESYLRHVDGLRDAGIPLDHVAIGSVCGRTDTREIAQVVRLLRSELPDANLHAFGVKRSVFGKHPSVIERLDSADSLAYDSWHDVGGDTDHWQDVVYEYLKFRKQITAAEEPEEERPEKPLTETW